MECEGFASGDLIITVFGRSDRTQNGPVSGATHVVFHTDPLSHHVAYHFSKAGHSWLLGPLSMTGKAVMRKRAAPIGIKVTVSTGWVDITGCATTSLTAPRGSSVQLGILRAEVVSLIGVASLRNGWSSAGQVPLMTEKAAAASEVRP